MYPSNTIALKFDLFFQFDTNNIVARGHNLNLRWLLLFSFRTLD